MRRTNADKRKAVTKPLRDPLVCVDDRTGQPWSDSDIAWRHRESRDLVAEQRAKLGHAARPGPAAPADRFGFPGVTEFSMSLNALEFAAGATSAWDLGVGVGMGVILLAPMFLAFRVAAVLADA
jgi:hypothetical protein